MFRITDGKGFHITFKNGYTVSVQFGAGNYCEHYHKIIDAYKWRKQGAQGSYDADIAVFKDEYWPTAIGPNDACNPKGYMNAEQLLEILAWAEALP